MGLHIGLYWSPALLKALFFYQVAEKFNLRRLLKNAQMQGSRNPEE
jgi:hypothetical protein